MAKGKPGAVYFGSRTEVRIVVVGDRGTGKSSLISTVLGKPFGWGLPSVLPPTSLPKYFYPEGVTISIIDTSSREEDNDKVCKALNQADAIVLTYACNNPSSFERLTSHWLPKLFRLEVQLPIVIVGCKVDLKADQVNLEQAMELIMRQFLNVSACMECFTYRYDQTREVFDHAQLAVLNPLAPLFNCETQTLKPRCARALKRIFCLCDCDRDGVLSDDELNAIQVKCFNAPLKPYEILFVKRALQKESKEYLNDHGLTLSGYLALHELNIKKKDIETTWTVLRKFGYDNEIKLANELIPSLSKIYPDQSVELTNEGINFLKDIYNFFDRDYDNNLKLSELDKMFSAAPECPWNKAPYKEATNETALGGLQLDAFLSKWALMTLLEPARTMENLIYIGYSPDPSVAIRVTRRKHLNHKKHQSDRNVFQCFVLGPKKAGKSALLNSFVGRTFPCMYESTTEHRFAVNVVDRAAVNKKTLVLREIPEDKVDKLLSSKESLAVCDVAVFVYDSSDESSWERTTELFKKIVSHGEKTGYAVPCLLVAAKDDLIPLCSTPLPSMPHSTLATQASMGSLACPIKISSKSGTFSHAIQMIVSAAERPDLNLYQTEAGRTRRKSHLFHCLVLVLVLLTAYKVLVQGSIFGTKIEEL